MLKVNLLKSRKIIMVFIVLLVFGSFSFFRSSITGFFIRTGQYETQDLNLIVAENQEYDLTLDKTCPEDNCYLEFISMSGSVTGTSGSAKAYLRDKNGNEYIILDKGIKLEKGMPTGFAVLSEEEEETTEPEEEPTTTVEEPTTTEPPETTTTEPEETTTTVEETTTTTLPEETTTTTIQEETTTTIEETTTTSATVETTTTSTTIPTTTQPPETTTTLPEETTTTIEETTTTRTTIPETTTTTEETTTTSSTTSTTTTTTSTTTTLPEIEPITVDFNNECVETCNLTEYNLTASSYTIIFELENVTLDLDTIEYNWNLLEKINVTEMIVLKQEAAEIGKPVKWIKTIRLNESLNITNVTVEVPKWASNIRVEKIIGETREEVSPKNIMVREIGEIKQLEETELVGSRAIGERVPIPNIDETIELIIEDTATKYEVIYETPAPQVEEIEITSYKKQIIVYSDFHYEDVLTYTNISEVKKENIKLYWLVNETRQLVNNVTYLDNNDNELIDQIQWITPYLSNQTYEVEITILNIQSYPTVGGDWTVEFNTTGIANLTITAVNGTTWSNENENNDLKFLEIKCGNQSLEYEWKNNSVFIEDYNCSEIGKETSKVLTPGKHTLEFRFGYDVKYAYNQADIFDFEDWESYADADVTLSGSFWQNIAGDGCDMQVDSAGTPSSGTGPNVDHTLGTTSGKYLYLETSSGWCQASGTYAELNGSQTLDADTYAYNVSFWYHMIGSTMGTMHFDVNNGSWQNDVWSITGAQDTNQTGPWQNYQTVDLTNFTGNIYVRFRFECGGDYYSDMAIDDINITNISKNAAPTTPNSITCDGGTCDKTIDTGTTLNCSGSTDDDGDTITYSIDATLIGESTVENTTDVSKAAEGVGGEITYRGREWYGNTVSDTATISKPSGTVDGDLLIAFILAEDVSTITADTGTWTEFAASVGSNSFQTAGFWRTASSEPTEWVFSSTQSADDLEGCVMVFTTGTGTWALEDEDYEFVDADPITGTVSVDVTAGELVVLSMGCDDNLALYLDPEDQGMTRTFYAGVAAESPDFETAGITQGVFYQLDASGTTDVDWGFDDTAAEEGDCKIGVFSLSGAGGASSETNTTETTYEDFGYNHTNINNITIKVEVDSYDPRASVDQSTNDPDLWLEIYNGTGWIEIGVFDLPSTYTGTGLQTNNENFSLTTTNAGILTGWLDKSNQDFRIKGVYMDHNSTIPDEINYTNVWVTIDGDGWSYIGNHTNGTTYNWDTSGLDEQTGVDLRCKAIDLDGSSTYSDYYTKGCSLNISHGAEADTTFNIEMVNPSNQLTNYTATSSSPGVVTTELDFNFTDFPEYNVSACVHDTNYCQNSTYGIWKFYNTGNVNEIWQVRINASVSGVTLRFDNSTDNYTFSQSGWNTIGIVNQNQALSCWIYADVEDGAAAGSHERYFEHNSTEV